MDDGDLVLRRATYRLFVELGRAPTADDVAADLRAGRDDIVSGWRRLNDAHALVLHAGSDELRMANPFSAVPTAHRVHAAGRWWYASCAWDALGIGAALHVDAVVETSCPDCGDPMSFEVAGQQPGDPSLLFHCLVPASAWWDDIVFT